MGLHSLLRDSLTIPLICGLTDDENIGGFSSGDHIVFDSDYTQLVTPGTHMINDSESDSGSDEQEDKNVNVGLEWVSNKFVWQ
jgi:hypothetical protein